MKKKKVIKMFKQMSKSVPVLLGILFLFSVQSINVKAEGGTFYHIHKETCYETIEVPCTGHESHVETDVGTKYCSVCGKTMPSYSFVTVSYCPHLDQWIVTDIVEVCQICSNILYVSKHVDFPPHTKKVTNLTCGKTEETPIASVFFSQSTVETTENPVILAANITVLDEEFLLGEVLYSFDGGISWGNNSSKAFKENGTYSVCCKDVNGTMFEQTFIVDCIVKPIPETPKPAPKPIEPIEPIEPTEEVESELSSTESVEEKEVVVETKPIKKKLELSAETLDAGEILIPSFIPKEDGISMEGIRWMDAMRVPNSYLQNPKEEVAIDVESRAKEIDEMEEIRVVYRLSPVFVRIIYIVGGMVLFIAIIGCIWYAYHNLVILYEVEGNERFFIGILIGTGKKERKVYISEKKMNKIGTKELLLICLYRLQNKNMVVHTPMGQYRMKWEKEMRVHM